MGREKEETFDAWVTKYALSSGIRKVTARRSSSDPETMISYKNGGGSWSTEYAHKNEWWTTEQDALDWAEGMRRKKLASLKKQIERFEAMKIRVK